MDAALISAIIFLVIAVISGIVYSQPLALPVKFVNLGDIAGMPVDQIIAVIGPPNSISAAPTGQIYQWMENTPYKTAHYAILVGPDSKAVCYTHQYVKG